MSNEILSKYYSGILDQLMIEVESINSIFQHQGLKGEGNENKIRELIKKFIPEKYGVDTGIIIDKDGNPSKQCDIIIFDKNNYPQLFSQSKVKMFPVDIVLATIEVKTTLDNNSAKKSIENIKSIFQLNYIKEDFKLFTADPIASEILETNMFKNHTTTPPIGVVFSYSSRTHNNSTFKNWFNRKDIDASYLPSIICCLDQGILINNQEKEDPYRSYLFPYIDENDSISLINKNEIIIPKSKICIFENRFFHFTQVGQKKLLIDQSKTLLRFILTLCESIEQKKISPNLNIGKHYFPSYSQIFRNESDKICFEQMK